MKPSHEPPSDTPIRETAARWAVRRDRGLSSAEAIEFELWLAADERHAAAMRQAEGAWSLLDRVPEPVAQHHLSAATRQRAWWRRSVALGSLAAAAAVVLMVGARWSRPTPREPIPAALVASGLRSVTLADGSVVRLNEGSEIVEEFSATERRVRLTRGEAHFSVTKNPARPFVVSAGALRVQAIGTAFNVSLQPAQVEVLVTEGVVQLQGATPAAAPLVAAGQRAVLPAGTAPEIVVTRVDAATMTQALAWQEPLLRLGGATLAEIAAEFERRTGLRVSIPDAELAHLRLGGRFRADDVDGFAGLLATTYDIEVERAADGTLVLRKKNQPSR